MRKHIFYLVLCVNAENYINNILNEPVSIVFTKNPAEKIVYDIETDKIVPINLNLVNKKALGKYKTYAYIRKRRDGFLIEFNENYVKTEPSEDAKLVQGNINATVFCITPEKNGYTLRSKDQCLTKNKHTNGLTFSKCEYKNFDDGNQLFDFIALDKAFYKTLINVDPNSPLDSGDYSEIHESDFDLEKKFRQSVFDTDFVDSMKFFYNAAACIQKNEYLNRQNEKNCARHT